MFGLGDIYLAGYKRDARADNRPGHQLGYLTDTQYRYWLTEIARRWNSAVREDEIHAELRRRVLNRLFGDEKKLQRYLEHGRRKSPLKSDVRLLQDIINDFDRRR